MSNATAASAWLAQTTDFTLPSGKVAALRDIDPLHMINADGRIRQVLIAVQENAGKGAAGDKKGQFEASLEMIELAERVVKAAWALPPLADANDPRVARGEAITLAHIDVQDKLAVLTRAMGGDAAIAAANNFLAQENERMEPVSAGEDVQSATG